MIGKSGMDGSDHTKFVSENLYWANGITTDTPNKRLYWVDAKKQLIESIRFDGTGRKVGFLQLQIFSSFFDYFYQKLKKMLNYDYSRPFHRKL